MSKYDKKHLEDPRVLFLINEISGVVDKNSSTSQIPANWRDFIRNSHKDSDLSILWSTLRQWGIAPEKVDQALRGPMLLDALGGDPMSKVLDRAQARFESIRDSKEIPEGKKEDFAEAFLWVVSEDLNYFSRKRMVQRAYGALAIAVEVRFTEDVAEGITLEHRRTSKFLSLDVEGLYEMCTPDRSDVRVIQWFYRALKAPELAARAAKDDPAKALEIFESYFPIAESEILSKDRAWTLERMPTSFIINDKSGGMQQRLQIKGLDMDIPKEGVPFSPEEIDSIRVRELRRADQKETLDSSGYYPDPPRVEDIPEGVPTAFLGRKGCASDEVGKFRVIPKRLSETEITHPAPPISQRRNVKQLRSVRAEMHAARIEYAKFLTFFPKG